MSVKGKISSVVRVVLWIIMALVLFVLAVLGMLYNPSMQDAIRRRVVAMLNATPGMEARLDSLSIGFPLDVKLRGLLIKQDGDTLAAAEGFDAKVGLLPLLTGTVDVERADARDAFFRLGTPDSSMYLRIHASDLRISPATVGLSPMDIHLRDGSISGGRVDMVLKASSDTTKSEESPMNIVIDRLSLNDFTYSMSMLPTIDSLGTHIDRAQLMDGRISLEGHYVKLQSFTGSGLDAAYIAPDSAQVAAFDFPDIQTSSSDSEPWTVTIDTIAFSGSHALYTTRGVVPSPGLDFAYISADDMDLTVHNFYNRATSLTLPIRLSATERCGVRLDAEGTFAMDSAAMYFRKFNISTAITSLHADGMLGVGNMATDPSLPMRLEAEGEVGTSDLKLMFPAFAPYLAGFAQDESLGLDLVVAGTPSRLEISKLQLSPGHAAIIKATGSLSNIFDPARLGADIKLDGHILDGKSLARAFLDPKSGISIPPMSLKGHVTANGSVYKAALDATTMGGKLALDADLDSRPNGKYDFTLHTDGFPVDAFMPSLGVGKVTADVDANGSGFDFFSPSAELKANANVKSAVYNGYDYSGISLVADLADGNAKVNLYADNPAVDLSLRASGNLTGNTYSWQASLQGNRIDLNALNLSAEPARLTLTTDARAEISASGRDMMVKLNLPTLSLEREDGAIDISDVTARFSTSDTLTSINLHNRDLVATVETPLPLDSLSAHFSEAMNIINNQIHDRKIGISAIQAVLPKFTANLNAGSDNLINDILSPSRLSLRHLSMQAANDSVLSLNSVAYGLSTGSMRLDTIHADITQIEDKLRLTAMLDNAPGNLDNWAHVDASILFNTDRAAIRLAQKNRQGQTGFDLGTIAILADSTVTAKFFPFNPTIGYKKWTVNMDNFLSYNFFTRHIDANLHMQGDDSSIAILTEHPHDEPESDAHQEDIIVDISDIHISDWIAVNPFAPPMTGDLSARLNLNWDGKETINGHGTVGLTDFFYNKQRVGSVVAAVDVATGISGAIRANADLTIDGQQAVTLAGCLNDSVAATPFDLDLKVIRFPLKIVNPFLPANVAQLSGVLNGSMDVSGDASHPRLNGDLAFDSTAVRLAMTGTDYAFSSVEIPVVDNVVKFNNFAISGTNENPLTINGTVDISEFSSPRIDLKLKASDMMIVNSQRAAKGADIFGKSYIDLDASVRGSMKFLDIDAKMAILPGTNITYILSEASSELSDRQNSDMVKFVNLSDSAAVAAADTISDTGMVMNLNAVLDIRNGTTIVVDLPTGARDKVQIQPEGILNYTQAPLSDGRLTGRINVNSGFARYTLPVVMAEKTFNFNEGSYVAFNGDILNPTLNIHATDVIKANVTQEGQNSRLVNFDVQLNVTGTLAAMDVGFNLSTDDDITVANELQSMSPEQRANQAMNMLLYNIYTGPGTKANGNLSANPLYSFLESQINSWAANNIKGVDLSFGIDQYNQTTNGATSSTMSYSYQISKTLFNDRFKIVVGGNYSTDADADENLSQNLINDISFEYFLNKQHTMLVKLFRHTGYESILEGEVTQTGVGFTYRRRMSTLWKMLPKFMRPRQKPVPSAPPTKE